MIVTHKDLIILAEKLGYKNLQNGLCHGFSMQAISAFLANDIETFLARLRLLAYYASRELPETLRNDLNYLKNKVKHHKALNRYELDYMEIYSFLDGIALFQNPSRYSQLFQNTLSQTKEKKIYSFFTSEQTPLQSFFHNYIGDKKHLFTYFKDLEQLFLKQADKSVSPMLVTGIDHSIVLQYRIQTQQWLLLDVERFAKEPKNNQYFILLDTPKLIDILYESISVPQYEQCGFTLKVFTRASSNALMRDFLSFSLSQEPRIEDQTSYELLLSLACRSGDLKLTKQLLAHALFTPEVQIFDQDPLYIACFYGHKKIVTCLLQNNFSPNVRAKDHAKTPLYIACRFGNEEIADILVRNGADVNADLIDGYTALHAACQFGHLNLVMLLVENGSCLNRKACGHISPGTIALKEKHYDIVNYLYNCYEQQQGEKEAGEAQYLQAKL